jgi:alpha-L-arabinofuranosidase
MDWANTDYMWQVGNSQTGPWNDITSPQGTYIGYLTTTNYYRRCTSIPKW